MYSPASLLKLPVMMAYFKKVESDPELLKKKVKYLGKEVLLGQSIKPDRQIEKGKEYTVEDLIFRMMIYSDNAALTLLEENIEPILIDKVTLDLGVETATEKSPDDFMSVKGYAGLFRILYNASYIEKSYSEKALDILSHTEFDKGLVAGIPKGVTIAHKFGEREIGNNIKQLHDCGIVYHTRPYLLCVMTRGKDLNVLANIISQISKLTYDSVQKNIISAP